MTADLVMVLADNAHPARTVGVVLGRLIIVGLIIWGIVHLIRKRRRPHPPVQYPQPQPYWDGSAWQYPPPGGPQPQPYWDGTAWQYPPQQPYPQPYQAQQPYPQPYQAQQPQPPYPHQHPGPGPRY
ncbi:MAG: hypothetical protein K2Y33_20550 [Mycolicibacterium frederiksbergense]|uniref:hypothetical protein n=1 Tax=Mycobacterium adipatum TaxID=1682113 RepID=UPI0027FD808D|nr:hypothetical protein [Mycolicibacterium frederiksbergense]